MRRKRIRYGVEFYLTKPIDEDELLSSVTTIKAALDSENPRTRILTTS